ncbi:hypothetical protein NDU88_008981 [Pleurodeles waltl]|uniref:Uncharacterized protein n=1 Tax=Pleurodeles waltl TaxID=8319 RepID=A0AAV7PUL1_PLEWA|nr:hypothetical protein NDU88_008981 [Pleurodeles waltl]
MTALLDYRSVCSSWLAKENPHIKKIIKVLILAEQAVINRSSIMSEPRSDERAKAMGLYKSSCLLRANTEKLR